MSNALHLVPGQKYRVIKPFVDYDKIVHPINEAWVFVKTNFVPYDDGLTLHVKYSSMPNEMVYRFQWRREEQAALIENFTNFVAAF